MPRKNLAARMGGWSAHHRWLALGLWFAFVIAAIVGGAITGQVNLKESQLGDGEAGHAARVIDDAGFKDRAGEMILITDPGHTVDDPSFRAVVNQTVDRVSAFPQVTNVRSPLASSNAGQVTKDGRSVLVQFDITGPTDTAKDRIQPVMNAAADLQKAHPEMHIAEFGQASADHVLSNKIDGDLNHARNVSLPLTLDHPALRVRRSRGRWHSGAPGVLGRAGHVRPELDDQPPVPHDRRHRGDHPDDRDGRRRRLLALLPAP